MKIASRYRDLPARLELLHRLAAAEASATHRADPARKLHQHVLCSVVVAELIYGAERSGAAQRTGNLLRVEQLRKRFVSLPFDDSAAEEAGRLRAHLAGLGTPVGPHDLQIAAIALTNGCTLVTHNVSEFRRVPGLLIEDWQPLTPDP